MRKIKEMLGLWKIRVRWDEYENAFVVESKLGDDFSKDLAKELDTKYYTYFTKDNCDRGVYGSIWTYKYVGYEPICFVRGFRKEEIERAIRRMGYEI